MIRSGLALRPTRAEDIEFLRRLYASGRELEMSLIGWNDEQKEAFLGLQFEAQQRQYHQQFPHAAFDLVMDGETPIGRLYVDRHGDAIRLIDITLLPQHRGKGIGGRLIRRLLAEARQTGRTVCLHVARGNPARRLYERLGFQPVEERGPHEVMEWRPGRPRLAGDPGANEP